MATARGRRRRALVRQHGALMLLPITLGLLLIWWGAARVSDPVLGVDISERYYAGLFSQPDLQFVFGHVEAGIGGLVALGLFRAVTLQCAVVIVGFSCLFIWKALIDPFGIMEGTHSVESMQHLLYPSSIIFAGALVLWTHRRQDLWALDHVFLDYVAWMRRRQAFSHELVLKRYPLGAPELGPGPSPSPGTRAEGETQPPGDDAAGSAGRAAA